MVPREQYDRQLGRLADDSRRHLTRARAAEQEAAAQRARADQAEQRIAHANMAIMTWNINGATLSDLSRILSAAPTAEQES